MALIENMAASDHAILRDRTHIPTKTKPVGTLFTRRIVGTEQVVNQAARITYRNTQQIANTDTSGPTFSCSYYAGWRL